MCQLIVDRCVTTVEYVRIVYHSRLLVWIKSCCYIERYSPLDLFEPASGVTRVLQHLRPRLTEWLTTKLIIRSDPDMISHSMFLLKDKIGIQQEFTVYVFLTYLSVGNMNGNNILVWAIQQKAIISQLIISYSFWRSSYPFGVLILQLEFLSPFLISSFKLEAMNEISWWSRCWRKLSTVDGSWIPKTEVVVWTVNGSSLVCYPSPLSESQN